MAPEPPLDPPQRLVRALAGRDGPAAEWLADLPARTRRIADGWDLRVERVVAPGGRGSLVVLVRQPDGTPAALKLLPSDAAAEAERAALAHWDGLGAVRVLRADPARGALLLERLRGEVSLRSLPEAKAVLEAASVVRRLWCPPPPGHGLATVAGVTAARWAAVRGGVPEEARALAEEARERGEALLETAVEDVMLHGDFRQGAVLSGAPGRPPWLAVGPEPLTGERAYDLARLVRDRLHDLMASAGAAAAARRRVRRLADALEVDADRLRGWSVQRAVESGLRKLDRDEWQDGRALLEFATWLH
jgi:streptomycin 6-kinase